MCWLGSLSFPTGFIVFPRSRFTSHACHFPSFSLIFVKRRSCFLFSLFFSSFFLLCHFPHRHDLFLTTVTFFPTTVTIFPRASLSSHGDHVRAYALSSTPSRSSLSSCPLRHFHHHISRSSPPLSSSPSRHSLITLPFIIFSPPRANDGDAW